MTVHRLSEQEYVFPMKTGVTKGQKVCDCTKQLDQMSVNLGWAVQIPAQWVGKLRRKPSSTVCTSKELKFSSL